jgi:asparagine synthase (glutamine-hydrolysing)
MLGEEAREPLPRLGREASLDEALSNVIEPALASGRCFVAFSGGRESSWLLAVATAAARSRGFPDPVPLTFRFPESTPARSHENQERVVSHLGLGDWEHIHIDDDFEMLGSYARRALLGAGILFPSTLFVFLPMLDRTDGGWLLAGGGLADFFLYWRWAGLADVLARRRRPRKRDLRDLIELGARRSRTLPDSRRATTMPWLRERAAQEFDELARRRARHVPLGFESAIREQRTHRCHLGTERSLIALGESVGAHLMMPFRDDRFMAAFASAGGRRGFGNRMSTMERGVGHLLPPELRRRSDGRHPRQPYFGNASSEFVERWSGLGLDADVVNPDQLRATWASGVFPWQATALFQLAFAHDELEASGMKKVRNALTPTEAA